MNKNNTNYEMKKHLLLLIYFLSFWISYAWWWPIYNETTYSIIIWEVWKIKETILYKEDFHPLRKDKDLITYYNYELLNPKYFSGGNVSEFNKNPINVAINQQGLWYYSWGFEEELNLPKEWSTVIFSYRIYKSIQDEKLKSKWDWKKEFDDIEKVLFDNNIYKKEYLNVSWWLFWNISCDTTIGNIEHILLFNSIALPYKPEQTEKEKLNLQKKNFKEKILDNLNCWKKDKSENSIYFYLIIILWISVFIWYFKFMKKKK